MSAPRLKFALADLLDGHEQIDVDDTFGPFKQALNHLVEGTSGTASGAARVQLEVSPQRVDVDGQITGVVTQTCSRCAEDFAQKLDRNFRQLLLREQVPSSNEEGEVELQRGDLDREELLGTLLEDLLAGKIALRVHDPTDQQPLTMVRLSEDPAKPTDDNTD